MYEEYQIIAIDSNRTESFASEPVVVADQNLYQVYELENSSEAANYSYSGYSGTGFVEISTTKNKTLSIPVTVKQNGGYNIDFRYVNGNGPKNIENKCAIRTLKLDGKMAGTTLFPQRGKEEWSN